MRKENVDHNLLVMLWVMSGHINHQKSLQIHTLKQLRGSLPLHQIRLLSSVSTTLPWKRLVIYATSLLPCTHAPTWVVFLPPPSSHACWIILVEAVQQRHDCQECRSEEKPCGFKDFLSGSSIISHATSTNVWMSWSGNSLTAGCSSRIPRWMPMTGIWVTDKSQQDSRLAGSVRGWLLFQSPHRDLRRTAAKEPPFF